MSPEVCPFCGKTYKRLKSHLPHCKAAPSSKTPASKHEVTARQTTASLSKPAKGKKSTQAPQTEKVSSTLKKTTTSSPSPTKPKKQSLSTKTDSEDVPSDRTAAQTDIKSVTDKSAQTEHKDAPKKTKKAAQTEHKDAPKKTKKAAQTEHKDAPKKTKKAAQTEPKDAPKKTKKAAQTEPKDAPKKTKKAAHTEPRAPEGHRFWEDSDMKVRITLQDVRATLGRTTRSRPSILSQIEAAEVSVRPPAENHTLSEKQPAEKKVSKSKQLALITLREPASPPHLLLPPPAAPLLPAPPAVSLKDTGPLSFPLTPHSEPGTKKQNAAVSQAEGDLAHRSLGQVRLKELPDWLACKAPTHPRDVIEMMHKGWQWYYRKYINVKKGGVAGVGMLLAGYCVLSYIWDYPRIKQDRWRKYH